ncbi:Siroheme synthase [Porphyridium purpureum]|uniref:uroporphyrinogen-III C-methyltransferase n=1 Tax=Porphyridium purpureum TaxID=35688 RepID=A0A5J4YQJ8_PORPP|nr:Siroheme synthase [Porphyridium purpureum]|eukprot:POR1907..scf236_6
MFVPSVNVAARATQHSEPATGQYARQQRWPCRSAKAAGRARMVCRGSGSEKSASDDASVGERLRARLQRTDIAQGATVYLVGTGPGDPELLTLKAVRLMQHADVILYDRLVSREILEFVNPNARMVYVGKQKGMHTRTQEEIHDLLRMYASDPEHKVIVRLKGGDPYVFGRGGEEAEFLRALGIRVQAVPGITSAAGIGAHLGIPLTHRGIAQGCRFVTGHLKEGLEEALAGLRGGSVNASETLVIYMGLGASAELSHLLVEHGLSPETPVAAVERGTTPEQRVVFCTIHELEQRIQRAALESPTLILVGDVVALSPGWALRHQTVVCADELEMVGLVNEDTQPVTAKAVLMRVTPRKDQIAL